MAKVQSSRAKLYQTKASAVEEATDHVESEGERLIKDMVQKQLDTKLDLEAQLKQTKEFQKAAELVPLTKYTSGQSSLKEFEDCTRKAAAIEELKACGLSEEEITLYQDFERGEIFLAEKHKKLEQSILEERLKQIKLKIQSRTAQLEAHAGQRYSSVSRHEQELGLSVKPNSQHTKLLQFALSCQPDTEDKRPINHPIHQLKHIEQELFGHLSNKVHRTKKKRLVSPVQLKNKVLKTETVPLSHSTIITSSHKVSSSMWDVKVANSEHNLQPAEYPHKKTVVYSCKPETLYTIRNKQILPLDKVSNETTPISDTEDCKGQPFVFVKNSNSGESKPLDLDTVQKNRLSLEEILKLPRFQNYSKGTPTEVLYLKNLAPAVNETDLVSLFAGFEDDQKIVYRLMTGRMRGQAFITFPSVEKARMALSAVNGYVLKGKPVIIQFGKSK